MFSAADFEDFRQPRPDMPPEMEGELEDGRAHPRREPLAVAPARHLRRDDQRARSTCSRSVNQDVPLDGLHWFFDHAETISDRNHRPHRRARRRHRRAAPHGLPGRVLRRALRRRRRRGARRRSQRMLETGVQVSAGTDATRVASYNPWVSLSWLVTGKTVGGLQHLPAAQLPRPRDGAAACGPRTSTWFSNEEGKKGRIAVGPARRPDRARPRLLRLRRERDRRHRRRVLTMVGGKVVYAAGDFAALDDGAPPPAMPDWSPVRRFGGYAAWGDAGRADAEDAARRPPRPAAAPAPAASMATTTRGLGQQAAGVRPQELLGRARLRLLGVLTSGLFPAHPCWSP